MNLFNLSLDDFSPHPHAGLNFESIEWCIRLIDLWPNIKINLFVPVRYARLEEQTHPISEYPDWCKKVNRLPNNFQIGLHGLYHRTSSADFVFHYPESNNDEFRYLDDFRTSILVYEMMREIEKAKLRYSKVFRPPRWSISEEATQILVDRGFTIAGHEDYYEQCKEILGLRWISVNWHLIGEPPEGDVIAAGHTSDWTYNYFNKDRFETVKRLLESRQYTFRHLSDWAF